MSNLIIVLAPAQRMIGREIGQQRLLKCLGTLLLILFLANPIVQVAMSLDFRILQRFCPATQLSRTTFRDRFKI